MKTIFKTLSSVSLAATLVFSANNSTAQAFEEGTSSASIGYGFGKIGYNINPRFKNTVLARMYGIGSVYQFSYLGPLFLKYEYAISDKFGLGLNVSYLTSTAEFTSTDFKNEVFNNSINRTGYNIMMRFNWHFGDHDMIDPYFGLAGGYKNNIWSSDFEDQGLWQHEVNMSSLYPVGIEATFGTRFLFTDNVGAYVEIGLARAFFQFGVTGKF